VLADEFSEISKLLRSASIVVQPTFLKTDMVLDYEETENRA
jgi:hypothetical protein